VATRFDFDELTADSASLFPAHGWIVTASGFKVVRLPVMRLFQPGEPSYARYSERGLAGTWLQFRSPVRTLKQLGVCFCDAHREVREALRVAELDLFDAAPSRDRDEALSRQHEANDRLEVLLIAAFTLLRRLADELIDASRPLLFKKWGSAPGQMKNAISAAQDGGLDRHGPVCDLALLQHLLISQTNWFHRLRKGDGLRDILIHKPHLLQIRPGGVSGDGTNWDWHVHAHLVREPRKPDVAMRVNDLFPELLECIRSACDFMRALYILVVGSGGEYRRGDYLHVMGMTDDIAGFWPAVRPGRTPFPIRV